MKNIYYPLMVAMMAVATLSSCGDKDKPVNPVPGTVDGSLLGISTASIETKAPILVFGANDDMNVYAKTYGRIDAPNIVDDVKATYDGAKWTLTPAVGITEKQKNAFVFAVAPYDPANTNPQSIKVDMNKQVDLMYSGNYVPASFNSPNVKLNMKHALSLMSVNIVPLGYSGAGNITSLTLQGQVVNTTALMDASTGKLREEGDADKAVKVNVAKTLEQGGWTSNIPGIWVIPFNTKTGKATLTAVIDGQEFVAEIPEVTMKQGWQYIFRLVLTNGGLEFDPSKTETASLNVNTDDKQEFQNHGRIMFTTSGSWFNLPTQSGNAVFGTISTPAGHKSYEGGIKIEGLKTGDQVVVETWNSDGFSIPSLDGIDTIDMTDYE